MTINPNRTWRYPSRGWPGPQTGCSHEDSRGDGLAMDVEQTVLRFVDNRIDNARARAFGGPVLRSLSQDAIFMGYSVTAGREADQKVEANHILRSSLSSGERAGFTTRTVLDWNHPRQELEAHALDYVTNHHPGWRVAGITQDGRDQLLGLIRRLPNVQLGVSIDGWVYRALASELEGMTFTLLVDEGSGALISIAAPTPILDEEFTTRID